MTLRLKTTAAAAALLLAGSATASPDEAGITFCSRMLEASLPHPVGARKFRIELLNKGHVDTEEEYAVGEMTYDLRAVEAGTGHPVAVAACTVKDGEVIAMLLESRATGAPSLAGRF